MNTSVRGEVLRLLDKLQQIGRTGDELEEVCQVGREFARMGVRAGTHLVVKEVAKVIAHVSDKASILVQFSTLLPDLFPDLGVILVTERTEDLRTILPCFLTLLGPCVPEDLTKVVLVSRMLERFPEMEDWAFLPSLAVTSVDELLTPKLLALHYSLAKRRSLISPPSLPALQLHFSAPSSTLHCQLLLDLLSLTLSPPSPPALPQLITATTVSETLQKLSYNDEYLVDAAKLCILLGQQVSIFELDPYSVFYHFCSLLEWSSETFFDVLIDSEAELLELVVLFAKEAAGSWRKWAEYVYVWHLYLQRKTEVDGFLRNICGKLKARRHLLHFNPRVIVNQLQRLFKPYPA